MLIGIRIGVSGIRNVEGPGLLIHSNRSGVRAGALLLLVKQSVVIETAMWYQVRPLQDRS